MDNVTWLMGANVAVWLGIGAYIAFLAQGQSALKKRLALKERMEDVENV